MKKVKTLLLSMTLVMTVGFMSCEEKNQEVDIDPQETIRGASRLAKVDTSMFDNSNMDKWQETRTSEIPQNVQEYLSTTYPGVNIEEAWLTDTGEYVILLENDMVAIFNASGALILAFDLSEIFNDEDFDDEGFDDEDWEDIEVSDLPQSILDYIAANYPDAKIEETAIDTATGEYIVILDIGICVIFDQDGNFIEEIDEDEDEFDEEEWDEIDPAELPQTILDYIAANHAGASIEEAGIEVETGNYAVLLDSGIGLIFDEDGNFIEDFDEDDFDDEDYDEDYDEVDPKDLPQAILDYIAANHAGATIEEAGIEIETGNYVVLLDSGIALEFDENGKFLEQYEEPAEVKIEDLSAAITDYIKANYPDQTIEEAWFDKEEEEYYIVLSNDVVVIFDKDGNFIEEETD